MILRSFRAQARTPEVREGASVSNVMVNYSEGRKRGPRCSFKSLTSIGLPSMRSVFVDPSA